MISFTGSTATGRRIMAKSGAHREAPQPRARAGSRRTWCSTTPTSRRSPARRSSTCFHAGQACADLTRLLVPRSRYDEAIEAMAPGFETVPYGDPTDPEGRSWAR